jgi:hypothetical protein
MGLPLLPLRETVRLPDQLPPRRKRRRVPGPSDAALALRSDFQAAEGDVPRLASLPLMLST